MALVICALGALGITAWLSLFNARVGHIDAIEMGVQRRISLQNSKAAAREYIYRNVVTETTTPTVATTQGTDNWFEYSIPTPGTWAGAPMAALSTAQTNQFSLASGTIYGQDLTVAVSDKRGVSNINYTYQIRSRSPMLGGELFTMHEPTLNPSATNIVDGNLNVYGRAVIYPGEPDSNMGSLAALEYISPAVSNPTLELKEPSAPSGPSVPPSNYPLPPMINAKVSGAAVYAGQLNVVRGGTGNEENSLYDVVMSKGPVMANGAISGGPDRGVTVLGSGDVTIQLDDLALQAVFVHNTPRVWLQGQTSVSQYNAAAGLPPVMIVVNRQLGEADLQSIFLMGANSRRLIFGVKKDQPGVEISAVFWNSYSNPQWRLLLTAENTVLRLQNAFGGTVTMVGGIRSDRSVIQENIGLPGRIDLVQDLDPLTLDALGARTAWVEAYRQ